ncbi:MAG: DUF309 domain-containing protein [Deltaproteobacteria bacterium]|nr:DUF309 domain-containing protein [Deltaproteobacteria bacterium]
MKKGIGLFNSGRFFECHESLEDLYLHTDEQQHKPFLEGLVQLATACRIFQDFGETIGPIRMVRQAIIRLENYQPDYLGIKVDSLIRSLESWTDRLESKGSPPKQSMDPAPQIPLCQLPTP